MKFEAKKTASVKRKSGWERKGERRGEKREWRERRRGRGRRRQEWREAAVGSCGNWWKHATKPLKLLSSEDKSLSIIKEINLEINCFLS